MRLLDLILQEYFAIVEHLKNNRNETGDQIIIDNQLFYSLLDKNLYIKRNDKLKVYKQLNLIHCNANGYTSVIRDKETKKSCRKIIINVQSYSVLKKLYQVDIKI